MTTRFALARTLLTGVALIALCGGMQGTLLGVRASLEGFSLDAIGLIMSAYYAGFLLGAWLTPLSVAQVGHIRVFAALSSMASVTILLHAAFVEPAWWYLFRLLSGFCFSGLYLVAGKLAQRRVLQRQPGAAIWPPTCSPSPWGSSPGRQWSTSGRRAALSPFILASVILSVAMIPVLLSSIAAPPIEFSEHLHLVRFIRATPLGAVAVLVQGMTLGAIMWMTAVLGRELGHSVTASSMLVGTLMAGGLAVLIPIGRLSDVQDRRHTLLLLASAAAVAAFLVPAAAAFGNFWLLAFMLFLVGGAVQPMYSVSISIINDQLSSHQILSASSGIILINGVGGLLGPLLGARAMSLFGAPSLYYFVAALNALLIGFTLYRMGVRPPVASEVPSELTAVVMPTSRVVVANAMDEADQGDGSP